MKSVKEIWDTLRPVQNDEEMARLMFCKAKRLEESNKMLLAALKYVRENHHEGLGVFEDTIILAIEAAETVEVPK